jgi:hypothetical protein|tara:strand:- start:805 stop:3942 length:3138 start_codon:yes stop_codon:yes gene_type:complete
MSYEDITLIDCNRLQSTEYLGGNLTSKALWTNLVGSGLQVNAGDTVSVHNSFISETGSTSGIEFNDKFLERKNITYTKLTPELYLTHNDSASFRNERQMGYQRVSASNITEEVIVRQNKCNILYNYYKTSNGENYYNLPRRFCTEHVVGSAESWTGIDNDNSGKAYENPALISAIGASFLANSTEQMFHCDADYFWFQNGSSVKNASENFLKMRNDNSRFKIFINKETRYGYQTDVTLQPETWSLLYYNKWSPAYYEYLEYIEKLEIEIPSGFSSEQAVGQTITDTLRTVSQPQINNYISLSASAISQIQATNLMKDLPMSLELNTNTYKTFWSNGVRLSDKATWTTWNACVRENTVLVNPINDDETGQSNNYLSGMQYIGVKRPELFLRNREYCKTYGYNHGNLNTATIGLESDLLQANFLNYNDFTEDGDYHIIKTNILWASVNNQLALSRIFKEQGNHPELFTNRYNQYFGFTTENNSRFLHLNVLCNASRLNNGSITEEIIGWDYMTTGADLSGDNFQIQNLMSAPLFIDYNPAYENIQTSGDSWDSGYRYGFLKRYVSDGTGGLISGREYCAFTTAHFGIGNNNSTVMPNYTSIPKPYFGLNSHASGLSTTILKETGMGIDVHFNSYGNQVIGLLDGYLDHNPDGTSFNTMNTTLYNASFPYSPDASVPNYQYVNKIYLGANNPSVDFNNITGRFEISNLHTAERVQNLFNADGVKYGPDSSASGVGIPVAESPTAGLEVYKINKRLFDNNFTPTMMPYSVNNCSIRLRKSNPIETVAFIETYNLNPNMEAWTIFDQLSGIIIKDFGYSSSTWTDGIWGILGFTYEAFNSSRNSTNDLTTRIGTGNKENLPYAITNADVTSKQVLDFATNVWGAGQYTLQVPITQQFNATVHEIGTEPHDWLVRNQLLESFPAISESASSVKLVAKNLPKKIVNGYYVIRSDILDNTTYNGGQTGQKAPIVQIVDKNNNNNDFFVGGESSLNFTFNKPTTITNITTSIHQPNQSLSDVDSSSCVIYKITRMVPENFDIVNQILKEEKNKK